MKNRCFRFPASRRSAAASRIGRAALAAAALALASCWHPAFDPEISGSEAVIRKLGAPTLQFSKDGVKGWEMERAWFLPIAANLPSLLYDTNGLLIRPDNNVLRINAVRFEVATNLADVDLSTGTEYFNAFGDLYTLYASPSGDRQALISSEVIKITHLSSFNPFTDTKYDPPSIHGTFGYGMVRGDSPAHEAVIAWLGYLDAGATVPGYYRSAPPSNWSSGAPVLAPPQNIPFNDHGFVDRTKPGKAFGTSTSYLYLSCSLLDGSKAIFRWNMPPSLQPVRFPEIYGPLIGALSDGRLLAEKDGLLTVLDKDLRRLFSFPAGRLRFVHERWDGTRMISVFTRTVFVETDEDEIGRLKIEVYEIPSLELYKLAN